MSKNHFYIHPQPLCTYVTIFVDGANAELFKNTTFF